MVFWGLFRFLPKMCRPSGSRHLRSDNRSIISIEFFFDRWDGFYYRRNHKYEQSIQLVREIERKGCKS